MCSGKYKFHDVRKMIGLANGLNLESEKDIEKAQCLIISTYRLLFQNVMKRRNYEKRNNCKLEILYEYCARQELIVSARDVITEIIDEKLICPAYGKKGQTGANQ